MTEHCDNCLSVTSCLLCNWWNAPADPQDDCDEYGFPKIICLNCGNTYTERGLGCPTCNPQAVPLSDEMGYDPYYELKPAQPQACLDCAYNQQIDVSKCLECGIDFAEPSRIRNESWLPK